MILAVAPFVYGFYNCVQIPSIRYALFETEDKVSSYMSEIPHNVLILLFSI